MIIGIGCDLCECARIKAMAEGDRGQDKLARIFTAREMAFCQGKPDEFDKLSARFAAKEAALKALGTGWAGGISLLEVEVVREEEQAPKLVMHGKAKDRFDAIGGQRAWVSLSHEGGFAMAQVVLEG